MSNKGNRAIHPSIGKRLRHYREQKGYSLKRMEELTRISPAYIMRIEKGERRAPSLPILERLCEALDVSLFDLTQLPTTTNEQTTLFDLLILHDYTIGDNIPATPEIKEAIFALVQAVIESDLSGGDDQYKGAFRIIELAKRLINLVKRLLH
ncbi:helix-turn-helix domain-containing protein [Alicyclobacillus ferrooxydans]|uniref:helix-turn-helix domain-containing protein n=1 Tax=Alicyclobacillus ferrooxydans TaxID=471514 RepID=UPI0006D5AE5B|nr:helix-turn-helix transcriptional regulator [Alicyclobacillus ferrooxydans]